MLALPAPRPGRVVSRSRLTDFVWLAWAGDARGGVGLWELGRSLVALGRLRRLHTAQAASREEKTRGGEAVSGWRWRPPNSDLGMEGAEGGVAWCGDVSASKLWARAAGRFLLTRDQAGAGHGLVVAGLG